MTGDFRGPPENAAEIARIGRIYDAADRFWTDHSNDIIQAIERGRVPLPLMEEWQRRRDAVE